MYGRRRLPRTALPGVNRQFHHSLSRWRDPRYLRLGYLHYSAGRDTYPILFRARISEPTTTVIKPDSWPQAPSHRPRLHRSDRCISPNVWCSYDPGPPATAGFVSYTDSTTTDVNGNPQPWYYACGTHDFARTSRQRRGGRHRSGIAISWRRPVAGMTKAMLTTARGICRRHRTQQNTNGRDSVGYPDPYQGWGMVT